MPNAFKTYQERKARARAAEKKKKEQEADVKERVAEEIRKAQEYVKKAAERASKAQGARETAAEEMRKEQKVRQRAAKKARERQAAQERGAEKARKETNENDRAAKQAKKDDANKEREWIQRIKVMIKLILMTKSNIKAIEADIWETEQRDLDILTEECQAEERVRNSTIIWGRSLGGLQKENARKRKDRLMHLMGKKIELEQARQYLKRDKVEYELELCEQSRERQKLASKVEAKMRREMD